MGMSASGARFILLTAKKSNLEFEGQQINQQRTTLSSTSSSLQNRLLTLEVPTAPSSDQYTKTSYSFTYKNDLNKYTVTGLVSNGDGTFKLNTTYQTKESVGKSGKLNVGKYDNNGDTVYYAGAGGNNTLSEVDLDTTDKTPEELAIISQDQTNLSTIFGADYNKDSNNDGTPDQTYFKYVSDGETRYFKQSDLNAALSNTDTADDMSLYYYVQDGENVTKTAEFDPVEIGWSDSGRMTGFTMPATATTKASYYEFSVSTTTDDAAYNDAMNEYEYQKDLYNQAMNDINAKIDIIQEQDKSLELKLKSIDTEHNAVQTEIDAVKKVIEKNIEGSFKTFG